MFSGTLAAFIKFLLINGFCLNQHNILLHRSLCFKSEVSCLVDSLNQKPLVFINARFFKEGVFLLYSKDSIPVGSSSFFTISSIFLFNPESGSSSFIKNLIIFLLQTTHYFQATYFCTSRTLLYQHHFFYFLKAFWFIKPFFVIPPILTLRRMGNLQPAPNAPIRALSSRRGPVLPHKCVFKKGIQWRPQKCYTQCRHNVNMMKRIILKCYFIIW